MGGLASVWRYKMPFADPNAMPSRVVKSNGSFADAAVHQNIKRKKDVTYKLFFWAFKLSVEPQLDAQLVSILTE
jgi:hypothetical protein